MYEVRKQISQAGMIYKPTIFQRKVDYSRGGEWAVDVLIDCSGSMGGNKIVHAKQALATLAVALNGLPNVHLSITGFTANGAEVIDLEVKRFREKFKWDLLENLRPDFGNCDGMNIRTSIQRLSKYYNMKKLMIVISDGIPAYFEGIKDTMRAVRLAELRGIKVIGIGIEGMNEEKHAQIYPNRYFFDNSKNMPQELSTIILTALDQRRKIKLVKRCWED